MKKIKQKLSAIWEIMATAEYVEEVEATGRKINNDDLRKMYQGSFVPLLLSHHAGREQIWYVVIKTLAKDDEGNIHEHEMDWSFNKPMSIKEVIAGAKHIKIESDGMKLRWKGVSKQWIDAVDTDLKGLTAISAWATATCTAMVDQINPSTTITDRLNSWKN